MIAQKVLTLASTHLQGLSGHVFDVLTLSKPVSLEAAVNLSKVISKLSPLLGNLIEFNTVEFLNDQPEYQGLGEWRRQDPGFPDTIFVGPTVTPPPGFEIKAWFPLATEITARFKDSQKHFREDQTNVCMLAWLPDRLIFGKPKSLTFASSRVDPSRRREIITITTRPITLFLNQKTQRRGRETSSRRTRTAISGRARQNSSRKPENWLGHGALKAEKYKPTPKHQVLLRQLLSKFPYRLDTNFAKMDRIVHPGIEDFKERVRGTVIHGMSVAQWSRLLSRRSDEAIRHALAERFDIQEETVGKILE